jgi:hypothetical protein
MVYTEPEPEPERQLAWKAPACGLDASPHRTPDTAHCPRQSRCSLLRLRLSPFAFALPGLPQTHRTASTGSYCGMELELGAGAGAGAAHPDWLGGTTQHRAPRATRHAPTKQQQQQPPTTRHPTSSHQQQPARRARQEDAASSQQAASPVMPATSNRSSRQPPQSSVSASCPRASLGQQAGSSGAVCSHCC